MSEIEKALDEYKRQGVEIVLLLDDDFSLGTEHSQAVIDAMSSRKIKWWCETRCDELLGNVAELQKRGLFAVCFGLESLHDENLRASRKQLTVNQMLTLIDELLESDCFFFTSYMFCWDTDTSESMQEDIKKIASLNIPYVQPMIITPYPGSPIWEDLKERINDWNWAGYTHQYLVFEHPHVTGKEAEEIIELCYKIMTVKKALRLWRKWGKKFLMKRERDSLESNPNIKHTVSA